ncbi:MAG: helix-turn-helix domain-containing protein [Caulobacter sp.]|nr:helix-turn-helix domain-containing protein [Caulobacter sp.]
MALSRLDSRFAGNGRREAPEPADCQHEGRVGPCHDCAARQLSVCGVLGDEGLRRLDQLAEHETFSARDILVREGDPAVHLFNITAGAVRVYKLMSDGRRQIVGFLFPGDFLGLATGDRYPFSAEAISAGTACRFSRKSYRKLLAELPDLEAALLERTSDELAAAHNQILLLGRKTAVERLATFLADLAARGRRAGGDGKIVHLPMTRAEIADYLGLTTETVSRVTTRLKTRGVIRLLTLHSLRIENPRELARLAGLDMGGAEAGDG